MNKKYFYLLIFILGITTVSLASPPPPPPINQPGCWPPPCIPIDGGISLIIVAGAIYGGRKLFINQKEKKSL